MFGIKNCRYQFHHFKKYVFRYTNTQSNSFGGIISWTKPDIGHASQQILPNMYLDYFTYMQSIVQYACNLA